MAATAESRQGDRKGERSSAEGTAKGYVFPRSVRVRPLQRIRGGDSP